MSTGWIVAIVLYVLGAVLDMQHTRLMPVRPSRFAEYASAAMWPLLIGQAIFMASLMCLLQRRI